MVLSGLVLGWLLIRIFMFDAVANGPLFRMYEWKESDSAFFDEWARTLVAGDWLNRQPMHPYHSWHKEFADYFFKQHPEKLAAIRFTNPNQSPEINAGRALWNNWYGGNRYHQEPLYAYLLAILYRLTGDGVYWMLALQCLLGMCSGVLLWEITRRYFGDTAAFLTGLLYLFCGPVLFQEVLLLRSSWSVFFALLTVWTLDRALAQQTGKSFLLHGVVLGLAVLLHSIFFVLLPGALVLNFARVRNFSRPTLRNTVLLTLGFALVFSPVVLRNKAVGAPLFSLSSVGPVTFAAANVYASKVLSSWQPEASKCVEILERSGPDFAAAMLASLQTHTSFTTYLSLLGKKLARALNGTEWPNNENYYFYTSMVPALQVAFLDATWVIWCAVAGLLFAGFQRKKIPVLYLAIVLQLAVLVAFYVLGRFRTPLLVLCLPFAAFALLECFQKRTKSGWELPIKWGVAALCFYFLCWKNYRPESSMLDPTDYVVFYEIVYNDRVADLAEARQWNQAQALHADFLCREPRFLNRLKPGQRLSSPVQIEIANLFAYHYQLQSDLYDYGGNKPMAAQTKARAEGLTRVVLNSGK
ncbi:MAG: glycosyltransferase family 39 protein [Lewinellaceae bacterium]|nr:glycosyltransferase family 39 protein [Lewinellaceae bacterium]